MTLHRALKFVSHSVVLRTVSATFSLSLLASCSGMPGLPDFSGVQPPLVFNGPPPVASIIVSAPLAGNFGAPAPAPAAPPTSAAPASPAKWGDPLVASAPPIASPGGAGTSAGGAAGQSTGIADASYVIGPEDALDIAVWKDETLKAATLVRPDGGISFPLAGDFIVAGMTASQVRDELVRRLEKFIPEPVVTVQVVRVASYRIYVLGRVNKPGDILAGRNIDVLQALSIAGGMTPFANEDGIRVIRKVAGQTVSIPFQYSRVRKSGDLSQNITLRSGDVLMVP
jgi:polysaccharide biosynthesis/export protein